MIAFDKSTILKDFLEREKMSGFPMITKTDFIPEAIATWRIKQHRYNDKTLHFFTDDWRFNCVWDNPRKYNSTIKKYQAVITPDFSLYLEDPEPVKIWNVYKNRWLGNYWQSQGLTVIPSVNWANHDSFNYCFEGIEKGSTVAITTNTVRKGDLSHIYFFEGINELLRYLQPSKVLVFGSKFRYELRAIASNHGLDPDIFLHYPYKFSYY
ncbi:MAG: DUF4417 domain-containing protein [Cyanobacteria bacterium J149]|nr:MAG: DUF4417 domain-containing protein [Cyanobacteria bacterium J149]